MEDTLRNPIKLAKSFVSEPVKYYYNFIRGFFSLNIEGIDPDDQEAVLVNDYFQRLYAVEIAGAGESVNYLPEWLIDSLASEFGEVEDGEMIWVLLKDGLLKKNLIFTHNKKMATQISKAVSSRMLTFDEIFNRLLSLYFHNEYTIDEIRRELKQKVSVDFNDPYFSPINMINGLIRERIEPNYTALKFFQAIGYDNQKSEDKTTFDIETFFGLNFKGALYTRIIFSKKFMRGELEDQMQNTKMQFSARDKRHIETLLSYVDQKKCAMLNSILCVYEDNGASISAQAGAAAHCQFDRITRDTRSIANKTPLFKRYRPFSRVVKKEFLYNYIAYNTKLDSDEPHLCGLTQAGTFANFGFKKATASHSIPKQHSILLGTSGAGKTVAANFILRMLLGYDHVNKKIHHIDETNHVIFDIKDSFYNQVMSIKKDFPELVDVNDFDKNNFAYNIVDCETIKKGTKTEVLEADLDFTSILISLILSAGGTDESLSEGESGLFKQALRELYTSGGYNTEPIIKIETTHPEEYQRLLSLGYERHTLFENVTHDGFEKFKKPLLHNVFHKLKQWQQRYRTTNEPLREERVMKLLSKLETIEAQGIFSSFSKLDFQNKQIIYFRTDSLIGGNDYGYMVFAMQSILAKQIKLRQHEARRAKKKRPLVFFWYEEARNIFENKLFREKEIFERVINEWRSYDMVFFPITQEPQHIPDSILNGFEIKFMLTTGEDEEEKERLIENIGSRMALGERRKALLKSLPKYTMLIMYGDGAFTFKFPADQGFIDLIDT